MVVGGGDRLGVLLAVEGGVREKRFAAVDAKMLVSSCQKEGVVRVLRRTGPKTVSLHLDLYLCQRVSSSVLPVKGGSHDHASMLRYPYISIAKKLSWRQE